MPRDMEGDDDYYMDKMKEILDDYPNGNSIPNPPQHPAKLMDHIFIGNQDNAEDYDLLPALDITHVLNCAGTRTFDLTKSRYPPKLGITGFLMMPAEDFEEFDIMQFFPDAISFLDKAKAGGGKALVHCNLGVNRSGAICAAYLMASQRKPLLKVIDDLKSRRSVVLCNVGFRRQLIKYARARGLLDPVEEPPKKAQQKSENVSNGEQRYKYLTINGSSDTRDVKERVTPARSEGLNGYSDDSSYKNGWSDENKSGSLSSDAYKSASSKSYLSTSTTNDEDWLLDDDVDELNSFKPMSSYKMKSSTASRLPTPSSYTSSNGHDLISLESKRLANLSLAPASTYSSYSAANRNVSSTYSSYPTASRVSESHVSPLPVSSAIVRDVAPIQSLSTSSSERMSAARLLLLDLDVKSLETPVTDHYQFSQRPSERKSWSLPLDLAGPADSYLDRSDYSSTNTDFDKIVGSRSSYSDCADLSSISNGISLYPLAETTTSTHPLLAKPARYATCSSDSFKTTIKPKSYYHRKVIGRVPKYSDIDDSFASELGDSLKMYTGNDYTSTSSNYMSDTDYSRPSRVSNASGRLTLNDIVYQPRSFIDDDYDVAVPGRSTYLSTNSYDKYRASSASDHMRSSSTGRLGTSYRPRYTSKATYTRDLDDDIEAYTGTSSLSTPSYESSVRPIRSRVVAPTSYNAYSSVPIYGW